MRGIAVAFGIVVLASSVAGPALACFPPSVPYGKPRKPEPPDKPWCASSKTCTQSDIDQYNRAVDRYNDDLRRFRVEVQNYKQRLEAYLRDAERFAQCELDSAYD